MLPKGEEARRRGTARVLQTRSTADSSRGAPEVCGGAPRSCPGMDPNGHLFCRWRRWNVDTRNGASDPEKPGDILDTRSSTSGS